MRPLRIAAWIGALAVAALGSGSARAAWNNVFQVCCHPCQPQTSVTYYADPSPARETCTTRYVPRQVVQNVVQYETQTQMEKVTSYQTSYYMEPVVSHYTTSYYDPCTGCCRQATQAVTSFRMRSRCCPVESWVSRCVTVPVTRQQVVTYYQEERTSCSTTLGPLIPGSSLPANANVTPAPASGGVPSVSEFRTPLPAGPGVGDSSNHGNRGTSNDTRYYDPYAAPRSNAPQSGAPLPKLRPERIAAAPRFNVSGEVLRGDDLADANARLVFRRVDRPTETEAVKADGKGRFRAVLASGTWDVFTETPDGRLVGQRRIRVSDDEPQQVRLMSR